MRKVSIQYYLQDHPLVSLLIKSKPHRYLNFFDSLKSNTFYYQINLGQRTNRLVPPRPRPTLEHRYAEPARALHVKQCVLLLDLVHQHSLSPFSLHVSFQ